MMSKYTNKERKGLPGGPNEIFSYTTGVFSQTPSWFSNGPNMFAQKGKEIIDYGSKEYKKAYDEGTVTSYSPTLDLHVAKNLDAATVKAQAPFWLKAKREFEKNNPKPVEATEGPRKALGIKSAALIEWENKQNEYIVEQIEKKRKLKGRDIEKLNELPIKEQQYLASSPKYQTSYYKDFVDGVKAVTPSLANDPISRIANDENLTNYEKKERLDRYLDNPTTAMLGDAAGILSPLTIPAKAVQSMYKDDYSIGDALSGTKNNAGLIEDIITDPLTYTGLGLGSKLNKVNKAVKLGKKANKVKSNFKSEINWEDWVKKHNPIYDAEDLAAIKQNAIEYNQIEEATKANGTWMKNPDGSDFKGTPEQFIQQRSKNFKKAFPEWEKMYHGSKQDNLIDMDTSKGKRQAFGEGFYTTDNIEEAKKYAGLLKRTPNPDGKVYELAVNTKDAQKFDFNDKDFLNKWNRSDLKSKKEFLKEYKLKYGEDAPEYYLKQAREQMVFKDDIPDNMKDLSKNIILDGGYQNKWILAKDNVKSLTGNNGMFDITNPNIYKALTVPVLGGSVLLNEYQEGSEINKNVLKKRQLSTEGYKRNSPDRFNPYNIIPSGNITMEDVDFPILGIDNYGNKKVMTPGGNYTFPGDTVLEFPIAQKGTETESYDYSKNLDFETMQQYVKDVGMPRAWSQFNNAEKAMYKKVMSQFNFKDQAVDAYNPNGVNAEIYTDAEGNKYMQSAPIADVNSEAIDVGAYIKEWNDSNEKRPEKKNLAADWDKRKNKYVVNRILEDNPTLLERDVEAMNKLSKNAQKFLATDPRFQQSYWQDMLDGLTAGGNALSQYGEGNPYAAYPGLSPVPTYRKGNPINKPKSPDELRIPQIQNDPTKTDYEKEQLIEQYQAAPGLSAVNEMFTGAVAPSELGLKGLQGLFKDDYTVKDAIAGKKTVTPIEQQVLYDVGLALASLGTRPAIKSGAKRLNKFTKLDYDNLNKNHVADGFDKRMTKSLHDEWEDYFFSKKEFKDRLTYLLDHDPILLNNDRLKEKVTDFKFDYQEKYKKFPSVEQENKFKLDYLKNNREELIADEIKKAESRVESANILNKSNTVDEDYFEYGISPAFYSHRDNGIYVNPAFKKEADAIFSHEYGHLLSGGNETKIDYILKHIKPKQKEKKLIDFSEKSGRLKYDLDTQYHYNTRNEPTAFLRETRKHMLEDGLIKTKYQKLSEEDLKKAHDYYTKRNRGGIKVFKNDNNTSVIKRGRSFHALDLENTKDGYSLLKTAYNNLPTLTVPVLGGSVLLNEYQKGAETPKYDFNELAERLNNSYDPEYGWDYNVLSQDELKFYTDYYNKNKLPEYQSKGEFIPEWMMNSINPILPIKEAFKSVKKTMVDPIIESLHNEQYTVKPGDNLHKIANKYKMNVDDIIAANNLENPSLIKPNDKIRIPRMEPDVPNKTSNNNVYKVKSGDNLSTIAKANNTSVSEIVKLNEIKNKNVINIGQELKLPEPKYTVIDDIKIKPKKYKDVDDIEKRRKEINSYTKEIKIHDGFNVVNDSIDSENFRTITMPDNERIAIEAQAIEKPNDYFMVVDKTSNMLRVYKGNNLVYETETILGEKRSDAMTNAVAKDTDGDGIITNADKINGKFDTDWSLGNKSTGAGVFQISSVNKTSEYDGAPSINLANERGKDISTSIHLGTPWRESKLGNKFIGDNRMSNGCVNCTRDALEVLSTMNFPKGTKVYVLPEEQGNRYEYVDGQVVMRTSAKNRKKALSYDKVIKDEDGNEKVVNVENKRGIAYNQKTLKYEPIKAEFDEEKFKNEVFTYFDFNDEEEYENTTKPFIEALVKNKKDIMKAAQIPSDVYNQIAKMTFGIYGAESNFGDTHSMVGNLGRATTKFFNSDSSSPDVVSKYDTYGAVEDWRSVGYTQMRWSFLNDREKEALKSLGITSNKDLLDPKKSAIATATVLGIRYNEQLTSDQKEDLWNNLPNKWNKRTNYSDRVKRNSEYLKLYQKSRLQRGGEVKSFKYQQPFIGTTYILPYDMF